MGVGFPYMKRGGRGGQTKMEGVHAWSCSGQPREAASRYTQMKLPPHRTLVGPLPHQTSDFDTYGPAIEYDSHLGWLIHIASEWRGGSASQVAGFLSQAVTGSFSQASVGKARC